MRIPIYQVDAFTSRVFAGNPAAVCPLSSWLPDTTLQAVAAENNLSETAFFVGGAGDYSIRWFTPATEVDLCGHATLASAHVILGELEPAQDEVRFSSKSGLLRVTRDRELLCLDFPRRDGRPREALPGLAEALGRPPVELLEARDLMAVYETAEEVAGLRPDMARLAAVPGFAVLAPAPGRDCDFVSRFFAPAQGIHEDPVTGSAHCTLAPYWAQRLGRTRLHARQVSARGGELFCEVQADRVLIAGHAVRYLQGFIEI
jgi:PhzF family phenazine biosynthesis protein